MTISFRPLLIVVGFVAFWPLSPAIGETAACRRPETFELRVIPVHGEVKCDLTKSFQEIQRSAGPKIAARHYPLMGMAVQGFGVVYSVQTRTESLGDGLHCPMLEGVELRVGWVGRAIFIAKEVAMVSCLYAQALEHQRRHVQMEDEALDAFIPDFAQQLHDGLVLLDLAPQQDPAVAERTLTQSVEQLAGRLMAPLENERAWRREVVESPQELDGIRKACGDIDQRLHEIGVSM